MRWLIGLVIVLPYTRLKLHRFEGVCVCVAVWVRVYAPEWHCISNRLRSFYALSVEKYFMYSNKIELEQTNKREKKERGCTVCCFCWLTFLSWECLFTEIACYHKLNRWNALIPIEIHWKLLFRWIYAEPVATILGGQDLFVDKGSTINLTCTIRFGPEPSGHIFWYHDGKVSNSKKAFYVQLYKYINFTWKQKSISR